MFHQVSSSRSNFDWIDPGKVSNVTSLSFPATSSMPVNFYSWFIHNYSTVAVPITVLIFFKVPFWWTPATEEAFQTLESWFTSALILLVPYPECQIVAEVNASDVGVDKLFCNVRSWIINSTHVPSSCEALYLWNYDIGN